MTKENINGILTYGCKIYLFWSVTNEDIKRYLTAERDAMKTGYSIKTWKMRLFCPEKQMIETTEALYQEAVAFYYELLKESEELWAENLLTIQGHLEKLTVPGRDGREPKYIPPGGKLPVYFRRSAMNKAAMAVKTAASAESFPEKIDANITFFKGMYRDLTDTSVVLKLWNGKKWIWVPCGLTGRPFPKEAAILSPTLVHEEKWLMFHVPVKQENSDARTAKERMQEGARVALPEYMMVGKPIVASRVDAIPNIVRDGENGLLVEVNDFVGASEAVLRIYQEKELKDKMIAQGIEDVHKKFNARRVSEEHGELFERV